MIKKEYLKGEEGKKYRKEISETAFLCVKNSTEKTLRDKNLKV